jgi:hypothetical protein
LVTRSTKSTSISNRFHPRVGALLVVVASFNLFYISKEKKNEIFKF